MEAVMDDAKCRPAVLFPNCGAATAAVVAKRMRAAADFETVYRECLKNHAAGLGGYAVDGCGEFFMPSTAAVHLSNPASFKCAACGCHRNFHRRLPEAPPSPPLLAPPPPPPVYLMHGVHPRRGAETPRDMRAVADGDDDDDSEDSSDEGSDNYDDDRLASPLPAVMPAGHVSSTTQMLLSLNTSAPLSSNVAATMALGARKRFRTRFSPEQKRQMQALSERLGWRLQKHDEAVVDDRCREIGVGKAVFKVWMHNNKHNFLAGHSARRSASSGATPYQQPSTLYPAPPPAPAAAAAAPPVHADSNINNSSSDLAAADHSTVQPATASGRSGSPRSS